MLRFLIVTILLCSIPAGAIAEDTPKSNHASNPPMMPGAEVEFYKSVGDVELKIYLYYPKQHAGNESRTAIVFFFGGGWKKGSPQQFEQHCRHLASRGMVAMAADYRVATRHQTTADKCVMDAKSAIRWVRKNARRLGVDPDRIVAGGGSAGGHLAACTAVISGFEEEEKEEDSQIHSQPNGLALFNPALVLAPVKGVREISVEKQAELRTRLGVAPQSLSPYHQLKAKLPPTIIFHGKADQTVPHDTVVAFANSAKHLGTAVELNSYDDAGHGFFNVSKQDGDYYRKTMLRLDQFLVDHGLLEGPSPTEIKIFSQ